MDRFCPTATLAKKETMNHRNYIWPWCVVFCLAVASLCQAEDKPPEGMLTRAQLEALRKGRPKSTPPQKGIHKPSQKLKPNPEKAKQAIIRYLSVRNKATTNQIAEWQAIPLTQVSSNKFVYGSYEIDLSRNLLGQMSWSLPLADMGDRYQMGHGFLIVNSNGVWEAKAPSLSTFKIKTQDGQQDKSSVRDEPRR